MVVIAKAVLEKFAETFISSEIIGRSSNDHAHINTHTQTHTSMHKTHAQTVMHFHSALEREHISHSQGRRLKETAVPDTYTPTHSGGFVGWQGEGELCSPQILAEVCGLNWIKLNSLQHPASLRLSYSLILLFIRSPCAASLFVCNPLITLFQMFCVGLILFYNNKGFIRNHKHSHKGFI